MSGQANLLALTDLLRSCHLPVRPGLRRTLPVTDEQARALAEQLLEAGPVLVPACLTDEEVANLFDVPEGHGHMRRASLEEVARDG